MSKLSGQHERATTAQNTKHWAGNPSAFAWFSCILTAVAVISVVALYVLISTGIWSDALSDAIIATWALVASLLLIWRAYSADRQAQAAVDQARASLMQSESSIFAVRSNLYLQYIELLDDAEQSKRVAAISALWEMAKEFPRDYHASVMKVLCAHVRKRGRQFEKIEDGISTVGINTDVDDILRLLSSRTSEQLHYEPDHIINLRHANLREATINGGDFQDADFSGCCLQNAEVKNANLCGAWFNYADLSKSWFVNCTIANTKFVFADFTYGKVDETRPIGENIKLPSFILHGAAVNGLKVFSINYIQTDKVKDFVSDIKVFFSEGAVLLKRTMPQWASVCNEKVLAGFRSMDKEEWLAERKRWEVK